MLKSKGGHTSFCVFALLFLYSTNKGFVVLLNEQHCKNGGTFYWPFFFFSILLVQSIIKVTGRYSQQGHSKACYFHEAAAGGNVGKCLILKTNINFRVSRVI